MAKKEFTSFDVFAVVHELKIRLPEARVNNVYQLDSKTVLFKLHKTSEQPIQLVLEAGRRLHLTNYSLEKPKTPPAFCMTLRKYLSGAWIKDIEQHDFERVVTLRFKAREGIFKLILELFGEGNVILTKEDGTILQAMFFKRMRDRDIIRTHTYQLPPSSAKNPFNISREELKQGLEKTEKVEVVKVLVRLLGIGGFYAEEILQRAEVEKKKHCSELTDPEIDAIYDSLQDLLSTISSDDVEPRIVLDDAGGFVDVAPISLKRYKDYKTQRHSNFNEALDEFYARVIAAEKAVAGIDVNQFKRESQRLARMIADQEQALAEDKLKMAQDKDIGDAIYVHINKLQSLLENFSTSWRTKRDLVALASKTNSAKQTAGTPEVLFESFDGSNLTVNVRVNGLSFSLSLRKNIYENASEYYDRSKRTKQKIEGVYAALEKSRRKLADMTKQLNKVEALQSAAPAQAIEELASRKLGVREWFEKFRWFTSSEGVLVVAGKDVVSNEVLIKKHTDPTDIVFHAEIVGAPFAVVKTGGTIPKDTTLREAAEFAAAFSRAWRESIGSVDVYWVKPDQLSKGGPSGEFVPHGAFAVTGKRNWMRSVALRSAVGLAEDDPPKFVGGPVEAVMARTKAYVVLVPGDQSGKEFLKTVLRSLTLKLPKEQRLRMDKTSIENIREFVPYTRGRIAVNV